MTFSMVSRVNRDGIKYYVHQSINVGSITGELDPASLAFFSTVMQNFIFLWESVYVPFRFLSFPVLPFTNCFAPSFSESIWRRFVVAFVLEDTSISCVAVLFVSWVLFL